MAHGRDILNNARLNKGTAFSEDERESLGLVGLLPDGVTTPEHQLMRVKHQLQRCTTDLDKYVYLNELADHNVPPGRRRTMLREYIEAMRELWTAEEAAYEGEFVTFGPSWAWPKPVQPHIPVLVGAAGTEKTFAWIARSADGWITTPRDFVIDEPVRMLQDTWAAAGRDGAPQIVALDFKPVPEKLEHWREIGVTEVLFGLPDRSADEVAAYVERLAGKLAALR